MVTLRLGQKVYCRGYLKKIQPKKCAKKGEIENETDEIIELEENECVDQNRYKFVSLHFVGYFVGTKQISMKKSYNCEKVNGAEIYYIDKFTRPENYGVVAKVYYANNKSRLVPLKMIEVMNGAMNGKKWNNNYYWKNDWQKYVD